MNTKIPSVLLLVALPEELDLSKENREWSKNNINDLKKEINSYINKDNKVNLYIKFGSVGKSNIVSALYQSMIENSKFSYDHIINIGSVGGIVDESLNSSIKLGDIVRVEYAIQTDLDLTGIGSNVIGSNKNSLNFSHDNLSFHKLESPIMTPEIKLSVCGSSDRFPIALTDGDMDKNNTWYNVIAPNGLKVDVLDQEIGALVASINYYNNTMSSDKQIPSLISLKYVANLVKRDDIENPKNNTENAKESATEWEESLKQDKSCQEKSLNCLKLVIDKIIEYSSKENTLN
jgi:nucleoside phosphorylase